MKFSCFFTALVSAATVSAADNEAPVISLDLQYNNPNVGAWVAHNHAVSLANSVGQSFADICEVVGNTGNAVSPCAEPTASAFDHHDSDVPVVTTYHTVLTSPPATFVENESSSSTMTTDSEGNADTTNSCESDTCSLNFSQRAEYVIEYNAFDDDANKAETVTFALIVRDTEAPVCGPDSAAVYCAASAPTTLEHVTNSASGCTGGTTGCDILVELCNLYSTPTWTENHADKTWGAVTDGLDFTYSVDQIWNDLYDGARTAKVTSILDGATEVMLTTDEHSIYRVPYTSMNSLTATKTLTYTLDVHDVAGIFGLNGANNNLETSGTITLTDSIAPVITNVDAQTTAECGYKMDTIIPSADYTDCYDDFQNLHNSVAVTLGSLDWSAVADWNVGALLPDGSSPLFAANDPTVDVWTLTFDVTDKFGNDAPQESHTVDIVDNIAPTLYMHATEEATTTPNGDHVCVGEAGDWNDAETASSTNADVTEKGCTIAEAKDGHSHYVVSDANVAKLAHHLDDGEFAAMSSEVTIQHSAGVDASYGFFDDLMEEDKGFVCFDACTATTTTVEWVTGAGCTGSAGNEFNLKTIGDYYLKYSCVDTSGHGTSACRTIENVDKTRPVITVINQAHDFATGKYIVEASHDINYNDEGATCSDIVDDDQSANVETSGDIVDMAVPADYVIKYNCKDSSDNEAVEAYRTVTVEDTTCPTCSFPTDQRDTLTVEASFPYTDGVVDCTDSLDGSINGNGVAATTGTSYSDTVATVDVEAVTGSNPPYTITYTPVDIALNSYGNCYDAPIGIGAKTGSFEGTALVRTVIVGDSIAPTIQVNYATEDQITIPESQMDVDTDLMGESSASVNGWVLGAVASAVSGVALLGYAATRKAAVATSVPV